MRAVGCALLLGAMLLACAAPPPGPSPTASAPDIGTRVNAGEFGAGWPLTVSQGTLRCERGAVIFRDPSGVDYGLNDVALAAGYTDIAPLRAADTASGALMDLTPLLELGTVLC